MNNIILIAILLMYLMASLFFFVKLVLIKDKNSKWLAFSCLLSLIGIMLASMN